MPAEPPTSRALHRAPELLTVVNVWDAISAKVVADTEGTKALATASHSIAATLGYPDGEKIPVEEMIDMCRRIVETTSLPVSADLEGGYGDAPDTVRRAIGVGVVGANLEDQMKPLAEAAARVEAVMAAAAAEGVLDFVLNARTDVYAKWRDRDRGEVLAEAIKRGKAFLDAGAPVVSRPGDPLRGGDRRPRSTPSARSDSRRSPSPATRRSSASRSSASLAFPTGRCRSGSR
ncbi:isocitrate lyase/PEP mutase family protein [Nocardioides sp. B-3]|uniref:isocitrate lyase/PEP mutase family protein n=1 Tax=Nocardioides sp. B-3 TaxID=2895565 RepID=UPI0021534637|nr:isocitrate lyase/phosphoenolpyruvate mutase family protein [Nocardioides sp. B-3]UUZ61393.1 isocitrate lyase/phosphoenolpyruvate mutase family protein [Nocardioides sp. B-3]